VNSVAATFLASDVAKNIGTSVPVSSDQALDLVGRHAENRDRVADTAPDFHVLGQRRHQVLKVVHDLVGESGRPLVLGGLLDFAIEAVVFSLPALDCPALFGRRVGCLASEQPVQPLLWGFMGSVDPPIVLRRFVGASPSSGPRPLSGAHVPSSIGPK
jgi:hypothetical protein